MFRKHLHTGEIEVEGCSYVAHFFEHKTSRGSIRVSCEVVLSAADRIILDDDSLVSLQSTITRLAPATIYSRALASRGPSRASVAA
ncbi:MAG: hypothetical protein ABIQ52_03630 [Vicinamibacterales bacterium]